MKGVQMRKTKRLVAALFSTGLLAVGIAAPTASAQPVITGGLVNVTVFDVLNNNDVNVQVPIGIAANVCGINAAVIAHQEVTQPLDCSSSTMQDLPVAFQR
jgi:hypothetical protein